MEIIKAMNELKRNIIIKPCPEGDFITVKDIYESLIEPNLPSKHILLEWNKMIHRYVYDPEAIFILRKYTSSKIKGEWATRRGILTVYNNVSYVGVDNYFPHLIFALAFNGYIPEYSDFKTAMMSQKLPVRFRRQTGIEKEKSAYPSVLFDNVGINDNNWKLSHLLSANMDYPKPYESIIKNNFPNSENNDWQIIPKKQYFARRIQKDLSEQEIETLRIHFERVCNPLNYFLSPKVGYHLYSNGKDIGENKTLISYIIKRFTTKYGELFTDYLNESRFSTINEKSLEDLGSVRLNLVVGKNNLENSKGKDNQSFKSLQKKIAKLAIQITPEKELEMIANYLIKGLSLRKLEHLFMDINSKSRGGGFEARQILQNRGLFDNHKGIITSYEDFSEIIKENQSIEVVLNDVLNWVSDKKYPERIRLFHK